MVNAPRRALLIYNPASRRGSELDPSVVQAALAPAGWQVDAHALSEHEKPTDALALYTDLELIIVGGGDGTISQVAPALLQHNLPFAILPLGTANDLARSLDIPGDVEGALACITAGHTRRIDLGRINDSYFFNAAHVGLGVHVTHYLTPEVKRTWGVFSYLKAFMAAVKRMRAFRAQVTIDGKVYRLRSLALAIGNGRYYGGGNLIAEDSAMDDGLLHLYSLKPQSLVQLMTLAPLLRWGRQWQTGRTFCASGRVIEVQTRRPMEIDADGESAAHTPARFEVLPQVLTVMAPPLPTPPEPAASA